MTFIIPTTQAKKYFYFFDLINISSKTVSLHSACTLPSTAGFWPMTKVAVTMPQGLFPQTLNYPDCLFNFPLKRPHQAHNTVADLYWEEEKSDKTLNSSEIVFIFCMPLNHQSSSAPHCGSDATILHHVSRTPMAVKSQTALDYPC